MPATVYDWLAAIGGVGVIVIGISKFLGDMLKERFRESQRRRTEVVREGVHQAIEIRRVQVDRFLSNQYEVYLQLWETLQRLRLTVDALWERVTEQNILALAQQLGETKRHVGNWSIFFDDDDYQEIMCIIDTLEQFHLGKVMLLEIRQMLEHASRGEYSAEIPRLARLLAQWERAQIQRQMEENRELKEQFDALLDKIRRKFRTKLGHITLPVDDRLLRI